MEKGDDYSKVRPFRHIGIIDFDMFPEEPAFYTYFDVNNPKKPHQKFNRKFGLFVLCLKHIELATKEDIADGRAHLARLLKARTWEEVRKLSSDNSFVKEAAQTMYHATAERRKRIKDQSFRGLQRSTYYVH